MGGLVMPAPRYRRVKPSENRAKELEELNNAGQSLADDLFQAAPIVDGVLVTAKLTASSAGVPLDAEVKHGLGRSPKGFLVVRPTADVRVWESSIPSALPKSVLRLSHTSTTTVEFAFWVF
jgi:hypothetical protein